MKQTHPGNKQLTVVWILLIALTAISMISGQANDSAAAESGPLGLVAVAVLLAATFFKASQVLRNFLNLRASTRDWNVTFHAMLIVILAIIFGAYAIGLAGL